MIGVRVEHNKKSGLAKKPYLARLEPDGSRTWAERERRKQWTRLWLDGLATGDVVDGRAATWTGRGFAGGYFCAMAVEGHGLVSISRDEADAILAARRDGWSVIGLWSVEDGETALDTLTGEPLGPTPEPGVGDCSGVVLDRGGERRLMVLPTPEGYGWGPAVARVGGGFPLADMVREFPQITVYETEEACHA